MSERAVIRVSDETLKLCEALAEDQDISVGEACDKYVATGVSRLKALRKYSKAQSKGKTPKPRKAKKAKAAPKKAKKAKAKKAKAAKPASQANSSPSASAS